MLTFDRLRPCHSRFYGIARTPIIEMWNQSQARDLFNGLMRRPIFTQTYRVMSKHKYRPQLHQRCHTNRIAAVILKSQKGSAKRDITTMKCHTIHHGTHAKFSYTVIDLIPRLPGPNSNTLFPISEVRSRKIG